MTLHPFSIDMLTNRLFAAIDRPSLDRSKSDRACSATCSGSCAPRRIRIASKHLTASSGRFQEVMVRHSASLGRPFEQ
jgi:hypothetical protein